MTRIEVMPGQLTIDQHFDLDAILNGTQDFRWRLWKDDWHSGVLSGNLIHIRQVRGGVEYRADSDLDDLLESYFRLDEDIAAMRADLSGRDEKLARLMEKHPYLRVLRQPDPWGVPGRLHLLRQQHGQAHQLDCGERREEARTRGEA